jgi:hypothetical protein
MQAPLFTDIAADRAGVRFGLTATRSRQAARRLLEEMSGDAALFFPKIADLPEGLSEDEFRARFGDIDASPYTAMITRIDDRLNDIPLYQ